jgi:hypothetical protein
VLDMNEYGYRSKPIRQKAMKEMQLLRIQEVVRGASVDHGRQFGGLDRVCTTMSAGKAANTTL